MEDVERSSILRVLYVTIFLTATGLGTQHSFCPSMRRPYGASYTDLGLIGAIGNVVYTALTLICGYMLAREFFLFQPSGTYRG